MKLKDFKIGKKFWINKDQYLCTDIGTRVVVAIHLRIADIVTMHSDGKTEKMKINLSNDKNGWLKGPPYAVTEMIIDENDLPSCSKTKQKTV